VAVGVEISEPAPHAFRQFRLGKFAIAIGVAFRPPGHHLFAHSGHALFPGLGAGRGPFLIGHRLSRGSDPAVSGSNRLRRSGGRFRRSRIHRNRGLTGRRSDIGGLRGNSRRFRTVPLLSELRKPTGILRSRNRLLLVSTGDEAQRQNSDNSERDVFHGRGWFRWKPTPRRKSRAQPPDRGRRFFTSSPDSTTRPLACLIFCCCSPRSAMRSAQLFPPPDFALSSGSGRRLVIQVWAIENTLEAVQ